MVLSAALDSGYVFLSLVAILTSVVGSVYVCPLFGYRKSDMDRGLITKFRGILKYLVPSYNWKVISGWTNYSFKVISQMMIEREIGNRGSKSVVICLNYTVKEQRVNGNYADSVLRWTLTDFERNYQVKILSNQKSIQTSTFFLISWRSFLKIAINPLLLHNFKLKRGADSTNGYLYLRKALPCIANCMNLSKSVSGRRLMATSSNSNFFDPWFVTGFTSFFLIFFFNY